MSSNNPESQGQDWPIYPGPTEPARRNPEPHSSSEPVEESKPVEWPSEPVEERYAQDDAYRAYQSYAYQQPTDHHRLTHPEPVEGFHEPVEGYRRPRPDPSKALQQKYVWIAIGIVAAVVITAMATGGFNVWPLIIFAGIVWWIMSRRRKC